MSFFEADDSDFHEIIDTEFKKGQTVILKFTSEYCDACMALGFELEELEEEDETISVVEIECSDCEQLTQHYNITQVPTMVIYKDKDTILWHKEGVMLAQDIKDILSF
ncbi:MAG: thioredoxin family protein [Epsilonproteobacteria bacterium]|nr:thioredoxin family protein [Campylobacterota bacterium]